MTDRAPTPLTVEERLAEWMKQPGAYVTESERWFIDKMRLAAASGVGYGWMQQVIEWEWQTKDKHVALGPEYYESANAELSGSVTFWKKQAEENREQMVEVVAELRARCEALAGLLEEADAILRSDNSYIKRRATRSWRDIQDRDQHIADFDAWRDKCAALKERPNE